MHQSRLAPSLKRVESQGVTFHTDEALYELMGIRIAFSERTGGVSQPPYASLNLGLHVGDAPADVWENRHRFARATGIAEQPSLRIASAEQVHGVHVGEVDAETQARLSADPAPFPATDALITNQKDQPLLLCFADCVPVILVSPDPDKKAIAVVHSGWRGTLGEISGIALQSLVARYDVDPASVFAYVGAYIGPRNFQVSLDIASQFAAKFDTLSTVMSPARQQDFERNDRGELAVKFDLADAIVESLTKQGVLPCNIVQLDVCSVETTNRFFSYRAEQGVTGRHGALACLC